MTKCRVSEDELANDKGDSEVLDVCSIDFGHDEEHEMEFFKRLIKDDCVMNAVIAFHRAPTCVNATLLKIATDKLVERATGEQE